MMEDISCERNRRLYGYGILAGIKGFFGFCLTLIGLFLFIGLSATMQSFIIPFSVFLLFMIAGGYMIFQSKAQRFDYQMQSGSIIHQGDGWGR